MNKEALQKSLAKIDSVLNTVDKEEGIIIPAAGSWPETAHVFDAESLWAIKAALAAGRPLLVRGNPGTGKSQLAQAAAHILGRAFLFEVVNSHTECQDLQFYFDAVARLAEAQAIGAAGDKGVSVMEQLDPRRFLCPGVLWWALDWNGALAQYDASNKSRTRPLTPEQWKPENGAVVLIDEIDKAEADLPNGLLETLGNGSFSVPYLKIQDKTGKKAEGIVKADEEGIPPLVVITTNEERELPPAFVRRCLVLNMQLPDKKEEFISFMVQRADAHFGKHCTKTIKEKAAEQLWDDRNAKMSGRDFLPGQAEYLDLIRALCELGTKPTEQEQAMKIISQYVLYKQKREE